jgi:hypothetical protein
MAQHRKKLFSVPVVRLNAIMHGGIVFISFSSLHRSSSSLQMPPNHFVSSFCFLCVHIENAEGLCRIVENNHKRESQSIQLVLLMEIISIPQYESRLPINRVDGSFSGVFLLGWRAMGGETRCRNDDLVRSWRGRTYGKGWGETMVQ